LEVLTAALAVIRRAKSDEKLSMKAEIESAELSVPAEYLVFAENLVGDLKLVGRIMELKITEGEYGLGSVVFS
jgi:valyl-tRNA synthetase